jgi:hypothetical protein
MADNQDDDLDRDEDGDRDDCPFCDGAPLQGTIDLLTEAMMYISAVLQQSPTSSVPTKDGWAWKFQPPLDGCVVLEVVAGEDSYELTLCVENVDDLPESALAPLFAIYGLACYRKMKANIEWGARKPGDNPEVNDPQ